MTFRDIYNQFLTYLSSCTFADLTDGELESELEKFLLRALADFRFPQVSLEYRIEEVEKTEVVKHDEHSIDPGMEALVIKDNDDHFITRVAIDKIFVDEKFSQREVNVIIAYMKKYYLEWLSSRERNFEQQYYDADTRTHSQANMVQQITNAYKVAIKEADSANYDYSRMDSTNRRPRLGKVNE